MESILEMCSIDNIYADDPIQNPHLWIEFVELLDIAQYMDDYNIESGDTFFIEDHTYGGYNKGARGIKNKIGSASATVKDRASGTIKTTKEMASLYGGVTDAGGQVLGAGYNTGLKAAELAVKILNFVVKIAMILPNALISLIDKIFSSAHDISMHIENKMELWITKGDLDFFKTNVMGEIKHFVELCDIYSDSKEVTSKLLKKNLERFKELNIITVKLKTIRYAKTVVEIKNQKNFQTYFNPDSTYYKTMEASLGEFHKYQKKLSELANNIETLIHSAELDSSIFKLSPKEQSMVRESFQMVVTFANSIGKYLRYVQEDLKTIGGLVKKATTISTKNFNDAVKANNIKLIRSYMKNAISNLPDGLKALSIYIKASEKVPNIYDKFDNETFPENWTEETLAAQVRKIDSNFAIERIQAIINATNVLYPKKEEKKSKLKRIKE
jgi:hypothetical protein